MRVLVTGAGGYVGHQIATGLARAGLAVVGTSRRPLTLAGVEVVIGDHSRSDFFAAPLSDCDAVIHFAARTRGHDAAVFRRDNEDMTTLLCRLSRDQGKRLIYISSDQAVYQTGSYGRSKRACEEIVAREAGDAAVLRLTAVVGRYAPDMASTFSNIIQKLDRGSLLVVPGDCQFPIAPVWIGDIERALRSMLELEELPREVFEVCGPVLTLARLIELFEQRLGVRRRRLRLPIGALQALARRLKPFRLFARLPLDALLDLGAPVRVSAARLHALTGFTATDMAHAVPMIEGFPRR